ncbi:TIMELESS-interacting protein-like isoform X2 [Portunus trituberculatus]|nr:TIMELESS-interacting protein-like isoform X2 [Portunus trituberculatus]XP_045109873.1 TIMELESS-interacting protein-like isoform X2 [Portunus trituberculatus]XP_045109874.1 TIMELESS-interacting protein-like isoform X2 [Portunus trituberculatus]
MELDVGDLFGDREAASVRGSDGESGGGSDAEEPQRSVWGNDTEQQQQRNVWGDDTEEQGEAGGEEEAKEAPAPQPIKAKRVVANPLPKLDAHRLAGPRGMFALNKICRNFKFKGKGHEREDLKELLNVLEHWAHRMYPKLPFRDTLEQIEKLGTKKNVQVNIKKLRLDMFIEGGEEGEEDNVRRGPDDNSETTPVVDVFDQLLGITPTGEPPASITTNSSDPEMTVLPPASQPPKPKLTEEQRERIERNRQLAIERRMARLKQQQQQQQQEKEEDFITQQMMSSQEVDYFDTLPGTGRSLGTSEDRTEKSSDTQEVTDSGADKVEASQGTREPQETLDEAEELMDGGTDKTEGSQARKETQQTLNEAEECMDGVGDKLQHPNDRKHGQEGHTDTEEPMDVLNKLEDSTEKSKAQGQDTENMDGIMDKLIDPEERKTQEPQDTEEMDVILDQGMASTQEEMKEVLGDME